MHQVKISIFKFILIILCFILFFILNSNEIYANSEYNVTINEDTYTEEGYPNVSVGDNRNLYLGYDYTYSKGRTRIYLKFNFDELRTIISVPTEIIEAKLYLYQYQTQLDTTNYSVTLYESTTEWNEYNLNWANQPELGHVIARTCIDNSTGYKSINIKNWIVSVLRGERENRGIIIKLDDENVSGGIFWSSSCAFAPTEPRCVIGNEPHIIISYPTNLPVEPGELVQPSNNSKMLDHDVNFSWTSGFDPNDDEISYKLKIARDIYMSDLVFESDWNQDLSFTVNLNYGKFYWQVIYTDGNFTASSLVNTFLVENKQPVPGFIIQPVQGSVLDNKNVYFKWDVGLDENNDQLKYFIEFSPLENFEIITFSIETDLTEITIPEVTGGKYFARIRYFDGEINSYSEVIQIFLDYSLPANPTLNEEYEYIGENSVKLSWDESFEDSNILSKYELCVSESLNFNESICYFVKENSYILSNIDYSSNYYARVRAVDILGKTSLWSNVIDVLVDYNNDLIEYFDVSTKYISPENSTSVGLNDYLEISAKLYDEDLSYWVLNISDDNGNIVENLSGRSSDIYKKIGTGYLDGIYNTWIEVYDLFGNKSISNLKSFIVDNESPRVYDWILPCSQDNCYFNNYHVYVNFKTEKGAFINVILNGDNVYAGNLTDNVLQKIKLKEGLNRLELNIVDLAGNVSNAVKLITVDTIKPLPPKIYVSDITSDKVIFEISGEKGCSLKLFVSGNLKIQSKMIEDVIKTEVYFNTLPNVTYEAFAVLIDDFGNVSDISNIASIFLESNSELGIGSSSDIISDFRGKCYLSINTDDNSASEIRCDIPAPLVKESNGYKDKYGNKLVTFKGSIINNLNIEISYIKCVKVKFNLLNFSTWSGRCNNQVYRVQKINLSEIITGIRVYDVNMGQLVYNMYNQKFNKDNFEYTMYTSNSSKFRLAGILLISFKPDLYSKSISKYVFTCFSNDIEINEFNEVKVDKYFEFPFNKYVGVTQWYGYTKFQSPHKGIDFGATKEIIYSPADGKVVGIGWDSYGGECNQGGNKLIIQHDNGMYTAYFHLSSYDKGNGSVTRLNDVVKRGDRLAISGNTGYYNCKELKYHLHFEVRTQRSSEYHVDPVNYLNVDWSQIKTLGADVNKDRLSGNNPHPSY